MCRVTRKLPHHGVSIDKLMQRLALSTTMKYYPKTGVEGGGGLVSAGNFNAKYILAPVQDFGSKLGGGGGDGRLLSTLR